MSSTSWTHLNGKKVITPIDTLHGIRATYNAEFFLVKRAPDPLVKEAVTQYVFSYIDPVSNSMVKNGIGQVYTDPYPVYLNIQDRNNFLIELYEADLTAIPSFYDICIKKGSNYYEVDAIPMWQN